MLNKLLTLGLVVAEPTAEAGMLATSHASGMNLRGRALSSHAARLSEAG